MTYLAAGRIDEAASHAREALALTRRLGARGSEAHALCLAGDVASTGDAEDAPGYYREALALADELRMRPLVAHCHLGLGKLYRRAGTREQAQEQAIGRRGPGPGTERSARSRRGDKEAEATGTITSR